MKTDVDQLSAHKDTTVSYDDRVEKKHHQWGYADTQFEFEDPKTVRVSGRRYALSGYSMPSFIPFVEEMLDVSIGPDDVERENERPKVPEPNVNGAFLDSIRAKFKEDRFTLDPRQRLIHSHGQLSVDEVYRILYISLDGIKVVDMVFYPESEDDVRALIQVANQHNVCLVPYGGGTNVSGALMCPVEERRMVVSVDMRRMNKILWLDEENYQACVEAGISGSELEHKLNEKGFAVGHEPDSIEFSTLGGWISTNASGMKKNKYGNIEDIVLDATLVTPTGDIDTKSITPRKSIGVQPKFFLFGSEGNFGIITKAIVKIHRKPQERGYGSLVFSSFERGVSFLKELYQNGTLPASIRLVGNNEFRFGLALKPKPAPLKGIIDKIQKFFLIKVLGFKPKEMVACTIVMEGTKEEVRQQKKAIFRIAKKYKGISGGAENGKRGYMLTFGIAYIRDFLNKHHILGETFETSVPWNRIHQVCQVVNKEIIEQSKKHNIPGKPYLSYRITQTYHTGVCIYFTMGFYAKGLTRPDEVFSKIEHRLRQVILENGGSLSHHHGVGKLRQSFLSQVQTENSINVLRQCKKAMDPNNIFGIGNGAFKSGVFDELHVN